MLNVDKVEKVYLACGYIDLGATIGGAFYGASKLIKRMMPSISKAVRNAYLRVMPSIKSGFKKIKNGTSVRVQSLISAIKNNDEKLFVGLGCNFGNINRKFFSKFKELYRKAKEALLNKLRRGGDGSTKISSEMKKKILEGQRKSPTKNEVIGGHSSKVDNQNDIFAVEVLSENADGTKNIKFIKDFKDGTISKIKKALFSLIHGVSQKLLQVLNRSEIL